MNSLACLTRRFLQASYCFWALVPLPSLAKKYSFIAFIALRFIWILYLSYMLSRGFVFLYTAKKIISAFVGTFLFLGNNFVGLLLIFESILKRNVHYHLENLRLQSELLLQRLGKSRGRRIVSFRLLGLISLQLVCDAIRTWANHEIHINPIHGLSMPMIWLLRIRYIQLLQHVMDLNQRSVQLRCSLLALASGNELWQPYGLQECRQLQTLRLSYERIFECYEVFSDCYGWGILGLQLITGFEFVSNAYWMLEAWMSGNIVVMVFIYNAVTTLSMGSLIIALFWYGDAGAENLFCQASLRPKAYSVVIMFTSNWSQVASRSFLKSFFLIVCLFGVGSFKRQRAPHLILSCSWLCWYISIWILTLYRTIVFQKECRLDCMLEHILFTTQTLAHAIIVIHIFLHRNSESRRETPLWRDLRVAYFVFGLLTPILVVHCLVTYFKVVNCDKSVTVFYWRSLPSTLGLQLHLVAFLAEIVEANNEVRIARCRLEMLARPIPFYWRKPENMHECTNEVRSLKLRYSELYNLFAKLNVKYGESLLIIFIVFFLDFVFNSYWVFLELTSGLHITVFIEHFGFLFNVSLQLSITCWYCQQSFNLGRQIGCLISKLIKPLGSKRYNNLVCEFSLQTLHQRFVITAKDFFSLNLHLLSSMFAAVVTYLVILIQFMFAESTLRVKDN